MPILDVPYRVVTAARFVRPFFVPALPEAPDHTLRGKSLARCLLLLLLACLFLTQGCALRDTSSLDKSSSIGQSKGGRKDLIATARSQTGLKYKAGGSTPETGFDCSGFVCWTFGEHGIKLPRTTTEQMKVGASVRKEDLQPGDIVAFKISSRRGYHTGIYTGNGMFIHSPSSGKRISESSMDEAYWKKRFITARRVKH